MVARFTRNEVDDAFQYFYRLGCVEEDWTGWADEAAPTWLGRDDLRPITRPRELRELLAPLREKP